MKIIDTEFYNYYDVVLKFITIPIILTLRYCNKFKQFHAQMISFLHDMCTKYFIHESAN